MKIIGNTILTIFYFQTELLYNELESTFYQNPDNLDNLFRKATVHELSSLLKRWLRELPQPLLTNELIQLFYQCHTLPSIDQMNALSILCHLLPPENRNTLRSLLSFFNIIINLKDINKMNVHNVATIMAPSMFPPRYIHPSDNNSIAEQVRMAAQCCRLTNILILRGEKLFQVPNNLIVESQKTMMVCVILEFLINRKYICFHRVRKDGIGIGIQMKLRQNQAERRAMSALDTTLQL